MLDIAHTRQLIADYVPHDDDDREFQPAFQNFLANVDPVTGKSDNGKLTAAAWVIDTDKKKILLLWNGFLQLWLNPGGKYDRGDIRPEATATRELREEAGIVTARPQDIKLFDIDVIDASYNPNLDRPLYDLRFLVHADSTQTPAAHEADKMPNWYSYDEAATKLLNDIRNRRMLQKTRAIFGLS